MDALLARAASALPGFGHRPLTYDDFLATCRAEGILVDVRASLFDEYLTHRGRRPRITLTVGLAPIYRTFVAFHALGHWLAHPGNQEFYLGSPGWLHRVELEASTIGFLALAPWPGPPYLRLEKAYAEGDVMRFWVRYPRELPDGRVVWRTRKTVLQRYVAQLDL